MLKILVDTARVLSNRAPSLCARTEHAHTFAFVGHMVRTPRVFGHLEPGPFRRSPRLIWVYVLLIVSSIYNKKYAKHLLGYKLSMRIQNFNCQQWLINRQKRLKKLKIYYAIVYTLTSCYLCQTMCSKYTVGYCHVLRYNSWRRIKVGTTDRREKHGSLYFVMNALVCIYSLSDLNMGHCVELCPSLRASRINWL